MARWFLMFGALTVLPACDFDGLFSNSSSNNDDDDDDDNDGNNNGGGGILDGNNNNNDDSDNDDSVGDLTECELGATAFCFCLEEYTEYECSQSEFDDYIADCDADRPAGDFVSCFAEFVSDDYVIDCLAATNACLSASEPSPTDTGASPYTGYGTPP